MDESQSGEQNARTARRPASRAARAVRAARDSREWPGWALVAVGAVLCVLGWYGVSGERFAEQQIPYLASATIPGAALIVAGAVLVALRSSGRPHAQPRTAVTSASATATDRRIEQLYALLVEPAPPGPDAPPPAPPGPTGPGPLLAVPEGTLYHRPDCPLVRGKPAAAPVDAPSVRARGLVPCRLCDPGPVPLLGSGPDSDPDSDPGSGPAPEIPDGPTRPGDPTPPTG
ncbi:hypothetical protein [Kitasatospora sp. NPDC093806]|uniref:hypothetical protein n=1 Tax=Kitasatospora sp. NPDC093806 TaxID=3155075 RepID=UPI00342FBCF3